MLQKLLWLVLFFFNVNASIECYNCSSTNLDWGQCGGDFVSSSTPFNSSEKNLINCTGENAMCFVRSWSTRSRHAWIVQRGCYHIPALDLLPRSLTIPKRAMTCKHERYPDAEYKVCLCQANWCNSASAALPSVILHLLQLPKFIIMKIIAID